MICLAGLLEGKRVMVRGDRLDMVAVLSYPERELTIEDREPKVVPLPLVNPQLDPTEVEGLRPKVDTGFTIPANVPSGIATLAKKIDGRSKEARAAKAAQLAVV